MSKEVQEYYRSGKNDPSRVAAIEKLQKLQQKKKNAGKAVKYL